MKIYHLAVIRASDPQTDEQNKRPSLILCSESDLSEFSFFQRSSVAEFMNFFSTTVAERTSVGQRQAVSNSEQGDRIVYAVRGSSGVCATVITDKEYPDRVALTLAGKILDEFTQTYNADRIAGASDKLAFPLLGEMLVKYQEPRQADNIMKVQMELEETKAVLHKTIEGILERGTKLDNLVDRSTELSNSSKAFYKTAKKTNSCCVIM
ncbi:Longin-like domain-containing protein [Kickxella alabastrina]|uniref:Longin-like domain-containing protein n=1 Tax=Kickxella alabastrina TaxID=61397 RepID=UPI00221EAE20|nr:Longin-like domain-containing protein [Kickxella alabastrina]KAI7821633.1 Longin-like domain-containing protein [Kickxella alabastrina]KAJ1935559.1 palmitoyltransferase [Kickxella alabastrina]